jgi:hypothetical protein
LNFVKYGVSAKKPVRVADFPQFSGDSLWMERRIRLECSCFLPEDPMTLLKLTSAATLVVALAAISDQAQARRYHHHGYGYGLPYPISYNHNYGPGPAPGTFAYYDGPSNNSCYQGSAVYRAQGGRYPCF